MLKNHFFMLISMKFEWQTMFLMFLNHFFDFAFVLGFVFYIFIKIAIKWVFTVRFKKFKSLYNFSPFLFNLLWKIHWRTLFWPISNQKKDILVICIEIRRKIVKNWVFIMKKPNICFKLRSLSWLLSTRKVR